MVHHEHTYLNTLYDSRKSLEVVLLGGNTAPVSVRYIIRRGFSLKTVHGMCYWERIRSTCRTTCKEKFVDYISYSTGLRHGLKTALARGKFDNSACQSSGL